jgi:diamine N-acetyltransferase
MSDPTIRRATPADAAALSVLGGATFLHAFAHDHPGEGLVTHITRSHSADYYADHLARSDETTWIVETPLGAPVGYAMLTPPEIEHPSDPEDLELKRLYLLGPWQSGGWGSRLIEAVESEARARGARRLFLCVYPQNHGARRFYARKGFADTGGRQTFMVGDVAFEDMIWVKPLD